MRRQIRTLNCLLAAVCVTAGINAQKVIATIPVADFVGGGAVDPFAKLAYLPTGAADNGTISQVTVVDERNQTIAGYITLPTNWPAVSLDLNYKTGLLYVGTEFGGLFVVNPRTGATVASINVNAAGVAVNSFTNKIYVSDFTSNLYVVDGASNMIDTTIPVQGIENVAVNPFTNRIYAAVSFNPGEVAVVDGKTNQIIAQPTAASGLTFGVAVDPFRNIFYSSETNQLSTSGTGTVSVYNGTTNTLTTSVTVEGYAGLVAEDPVTFTVYTSDTPENTIDIIDGSNNTLIDSLPVGLQPQYLTDDPINKLLYVGCQGPNGANGFPTYVLYVIRTK
jgi:DNA-binding beta-propeller fold protein YncE